MACRNVFDFHIKAAWISKSSLLYFRFGIWYCQCTSQSGT